MAHSIHLATQRVTRLAKTVVNGGALFLATPLAVVYWASVLLIPSRTNAIFQSYSQLLSLLPGLIGNLVRRGFYRLTLLNCSKTSTISFGTIFSTPQVHIGEHVYIGALCTIGMVTIEDDVLIGSRVDLMSGRHQHNFDSVDVPIRLQGGTFERVRIGRDSWIGNGASVAADVAQQAIVAAGSVVVKPVPERAIVGGNPARVLSMRGNAHSPAPQSNQSTSCSHG